MEAQKGELKLIVKERFLDQANHGTIIINQGFRVAC